MNSETIYFSISLFSFFGALIIFLKNYPKIIELEEKKFELKSQKFFEKIKIRINEFKIFQKPFWENFLEKSLIKIRILILRLENFLYQKIQKLKEKRKKEKEIPKISFWKKIRKLK